MYSLKWKKKKKIKMPRSTAGREIQVLVLLKQTDINKPRGLGNNQQPETSNKSDDLQTNMECK